MPAPLASRLGTFVTTTTTGEAVRAFVPPPLPPDPPLDLGRLLGPYERANQGLGRLDGMTTVLPSTHLFLFMYVRKEALLSSQIEGTQSSLADLLLFENDEVPFVPIDEVQEVSNYIAAMNYGLRRISDGFPISLRLLNEMHRELLARGRGSSRQPGDVRRSQNWIGGTRPGNAVFVPPPPDRLPDCISDLERFINWDRLYPPLMRAALAHVQFETIHPYLDGNGRLGRLLITLILCEAGALREPSLYLSLYFKLHRARYYELLQKVREDGDWESWIEFFLDGVAEVSGQGVSTARRLLELFEHDQSKIAQLGRRANSTMRVYAELQRSPLLAVPTASVRLRLSQPTIQKCMAHLQELGVVREITGKRRGRLYQYDRYLSILDEGTEPLPR